MCTTLIRSLVHYDIESNLSWTQIDSSSLERNYLSAWYSITKWSQLAIIIHLLLYNVLKHYETATDRFVRAHSILNNVDFSRELSDTYCNDRLLNRVPISWEFFCIISFFYLIYLLYWLSCLYVILCQISYCFKTSNALAKSIDIIIRKILRDIFANCSSILRVITKWRIIDTYYIIYAKF